MLVRRRHVVPSTSTPLGSRVQPVIALSRGATFSGYDSAQLRSSAPVDVAAVITGEITGGDGKLRREGTAETIQFSPSRHRCSTPAGRGRCVASTTAASLVVRRELGADASFCNKSNLSARVGRHASVSGVDDRPRRPDKLSTSVLSGGGGLGFLRKLSRGSARSSPAHNCAADVSTTSVRRRSSLRDSFKRIFLHRRFGWLQYCRYRRRRSLSTVGGTRSGQSTPPHYCPPLM